MARGVKLVAKSLTGFCDIDAPANAMGVQPSAAHKLSALGRQFPRLRADKYLSVSKNWLVPWLPLMRELAAVRNERLTEGEKPLKHYI